MDTRPGTLTIDWPTASPMPRVGQALAPEDIEVMFIVLETERIREPGHPTKKRVRLRVYPVARTPHALDMPDQPEDPNARLQRIVQCLRERSLAIEHEGARPSQQYKQMGQMEARLSRILSHGSRSTQRRTPPPHCRSLALHPIILLFTKRHRLHP